MKQMMQKLMRLELGLQVLLDLHRVMQGVLNDDIDKNAWGVGMAIQALEKWNHCVSSSYHIISINISYE